MTSARGKRWYCRATGALLALLLAAGCATYPKEEMAAAEAALREARDAQAEKFAPAELEQAQRDYVEADRLAREKEYDRARELAVAASGGAKQAVDAAAKNREVFEENERRRLEEEARRAEEERLQAEEEARLAAEGGGFDETEIPTEEAAAGFEGAGGEDAFASEFEEEFGGEFAEAQAAAPQASAEEPAISEPEPVSDDSSFALESEPEPAAQTAPSPQPEPVFEPAPPAPAAPAPSGRTRPYEVRRYDTLSKIAARPDVYGDANLWPLIYEANRGIIRDPDLLPRVEIQIPIDPPEAERVRARDIAQGHVPNLWDGE